MQNVRVSKVGFKNYSDGPLSQTSMAALSEEAFWNEDFPGIDVNTDVDLDDSAIASLKSGEEDEEDEKTVVAIVEKKQKFNFERLVAGGGGDRLVIAIRASVVTRNHAYSPSSNLRSSRT